MADSGKPPTSGLKIVFKAPVVKKPAQPSDRDNDSQSSSPDTKPSTASVAAPPKAAPVIKIAAPKRAPPTAEPEPVSIKLLFKPKRPRTTSKKKDKGKASGAKSSLATKDVVMKAPEEPEPAPEVTLTELLTDLHRSITEHHIQQFQFFLKPVDAAQVPDYYEIIKKPIDLEAIKIKIARNRYELPSQFRDDIELMCRNAMLYNAADTVFYKEGQRVLDYAMKTIDQAIADWNPPGSKPRDRQATQPPVPPQSATVVISSKLSASQIQPPQRSLNGYDIKPYINPAVSQLKQAISTPTASATFPIRKSTAGAHVPNRFPGYEKSEKVTPAEAGKEDDTKDLERANAKYLASLRNFLDGTGVEHIADNVSNEVTFGSAEILGGIIPKGHLLAPEKTAKDETKREPNGVAVEPGTQIGEWGSTPILARDIRLLVRPDPKDKGRMVQIATKFSQAEAESLLSLEQELGVDVSFLRELFDRGSRPAADSERIDHILKENFEMLHFLQVSLNRRQRTEKPGEEERRASALLADHLAVLCASLPPSALVSQADARAAIKNLCGAFGRPVPSKSASSSASNKKSKSSPHAGSMILPGKSAPTMKSNTSAPGTVVPSTSLPRALAADSTSSATRQSLLSPTLQMSNNTPRPGNSDGKRRAPRPVYPGQKCSNCGTQDTPGWRTGATPDERLCNACGLYWSKNKPHHRPAELWPEST